MKLEITLKRDARTPPIPGGAVDFLGLLRVELKNQI